MKNAIHTIILTLCSGSLYGQSKPVHFYNFSTYQGMDCEEFLQKTKDDLSRNHAISLDAGMCEWSDSTQQTKLTLVDSGDSVHKVTSTHSLGNVYAARGLYRNQESCELNLETEARIFEQLTGLTPQVRYCSFHRLEQTWKWSANLTALNGVPERKPSRTEWRSGTPHGLSNEEMLSKLRERMAPLGMVPYAFRFRSSATLGRGTIHHYQPTNKDYFSVNSHSLVEIEGLEKCKGVVNQLESEIAESDLKPNFYLGFCSSPYSNPRSFDVSLVSDSFSINTQYSSEKFTSMKDCDENRVRVSENFDSIYPGKLLATVCGRHPYSTSGKQIIRMALIKKSY